MLASTMATRKVYRRDNLSVDEKEISGNPANQPVRVGDLVIKSDDLSTFVDYVKEVGIKELFDKLELQNLLK